MHAGRSEVVLSYDKIDIGKFTSLSPVGYQKDSSQKEISSMVEQPFYTRKVGCSSHLFLIQTYPGLPTSPYEVGRTNERFLDLTVKCILDKNDISVRFAEELKIIDRVV